MSIGHTNPLHSPGQKDRGVCQILSITILWPGTRPDETFVDGPGGKTQHQHPPEGGAGKKLHCCPYEKECNENDTPPEWLKKGTTEVKHKL